MGACSARMNAACGGAPLWCLHGHALAGVRVQKVQRVQRFDTAFGREGCGGRLHGHALAGVRVQRVQRVQRFDTAFGCEGCGGRLRRQNECRLRRLPPFGACRHHLPPRESVSHDSQVAVAPLRIVFACHPASGGTTKLREAEYKMRLTGRHHSPWAQRAHQT